MNRYLLALLLVLVVATASAQTPIRKDCVAVTCTIISDVLATVPVDPPTLCRLYAGTTLLAEVPAVAPYACTFTRNFATGPWSVFARYANSAGESPNSNTLSFTSAVVLPPATAPANLRFQ